MRLSTPPHLYRDHIYEPGVPGLSDAARQVDRSIEEAYQSWRETLTGQSGGLADEFKRLAERWKSDTEYDSSAVRIAMHPAYQRIIGMGRDALPLILRDLEETKSPWFWALHAITGEDPVPLEDRGYIDRMAQAWIRWGIRANVI